MEAKLKNTLLEILIYFKNGLDDIEEGSGEKQNMQKEINYALKEVKKLSINAVMQVKPEKVCEHKYPFEPIIACKKCEYCNNLKPI